MPMFVAYLPGRGRQRGSMRGRQAGGSRVAASAAGCAADATGRDGRGRRLPHQAVERKRACRSSTTNLRTTRATTAPTISTVAR